MPDPIPPAGDAPATPPAATPPAPPSETPPPAVVDYSTVKLPDGSKLDASRVEQLTSWAKDKKLAPDIAQEILNREHEARVAIETEQLASLETQKTAWLEALKADKEIGGDKLNSNVEPARRLVDKYASPALKEALDATGLGNHPELVRFLANLAKAVGEDHLVIAGSTGGGQKSAAELFYGAQAPQ